MFFARIFNCHIGLLDIIAAHLQYHRLLFLRWRSVGRLSQTPDSGFLNTHSYNLQCMCCMYVPRIRLLAPKNHQKSTSIFPPFVLVATPGLAMRSTGIRFITLGSRVSELSAGGRLDAPWRRTMSATYLGGGRVVQLGDLVTCLTV